jgi:EAL domain-containing protein (putative c-di-GMP-specific phosphodiesterase class I)/GGDEF domain-containing protein
MTDWEILNAGIEHAEHAIAVYQFEGKRKRVVCVSDGMFSMMRGADEADKPAFLRRLESDRYRNVPTEDARILAEEVRRFASGGGLDIVYRETLGRNSGSTLIHAVGHHHVLDDGERVLIVEYSDLTAAAWTQVQPRKSFEQSLQSFLDQSDLALLAVTKDRGELRYCNARMKSLLKPARDFCVGESVSQWLLGWEDADILERIAAMDGRGNQLFCAREGEEDLVVRVNSGTWEGEAVYCIQSDPWSELFSDALTGLPNLSTFYRKAPGEIGRIRKQGKNPAFVYVNFFGMKAYNARFGIEEGDRILKVAAGELRHLFPEYLCCRVSDDHFLILAEGQDLEKRLADLVEQVQRRASGSVLQLKAGVYDGALSNKPSQEEISRACDGARLACGQIRENARRSWCRYDTDVQEQFQKKTYVLANYRTALKEHWIRVYYQPLYDTQTGKLAGFECLARWQDPNRGLLSPADFIPVLEQHHLIGLLDQYILEQACREAPLRAQKGLGQVPVSFNISRDDFDYGDVYENVKSTADRYHIPHELLIAEITESAFSRDSDGIREQIRRFHEGGFQVWMDDFGSEYSSLGNLQNLDVNLIKLDIRFLHAYAQERRHGDGTRSAALLQAVVEMARALHLRTLCEGVETREQLELLRQVGCRGAQGYFLGRPAPLEQIQVE